MLLTEDEAKGKWCPFARRVLISKAFLTAAANRYADDRGDDSNPPPCRCIASACMAWRKKGQIGRGPHGEKRDRDLDGRTRWLDVGYCGLAGAP